MKYFLSLIFWPFLTFSYQYDLVVCAIFRDEARFLSEWIEFHENLGVQHFYLYNNLSQDDYKSVLKPYQDRDLVTLIDWPYESNNEYEWIPIHVGAFNDALKRCNSKWLLAIDTDEFVFPLEKNNLNDFLSDYEEYACVSACWVHYGTSFKYEVKNVTEELTFRAPLDYPNNRTIKSFVQTEKISHFSTSHYGHPKKGYLQVCENKNPFSGMIAPEFSASKIRINHYWTRDEKFLNNVKKIRQKKWGHDISENKLQLLNSESDNIIKMFSENNID